MPTAEEEILRTLRAARQSLQEMIGLAEAATDSYGASDLEADQIARAHAALAQLENEIRVRE